MLRSSRVVVAGAAFFEPCWPSLAREPPSGPDWLHEIKWDGFRMAGPQRRAAQSGNFRAKLNSSSNFQRRGTWGGSSPEL